MKALVLALSVLTTTALSAAPGSFATYICENDARDKHMVINRIKVGKRAIIRGVVPTGLEAGEWTEADVCDLPGNLEDAYKLHVDLTEDILSVCFFVSTNGGTLGILRKDKEKTYLEVKHFEDEKPNKKARGENYACAIL